MSAAKAACLAACVALAAAAPRTKAQLADAAIKAVLEPKPSLHSLDHRFKLHPSLWNNTDDDWQAFFAKSAALNAKAFPQAPPVQCTPGARELSLRLSLWHALFSVPALTQLQLTPPLPSADLCR